MSEEANSAMVTRFYIEVIDKGNVPAQHEFFNPGAVVHFPGRDRTIGSPGEPAGHPYEECETLVHHLIADGEFVMAHISQRVTFLDRTGFGVRLGMVEASGKSATWDSMEIFRFENDKISELWINRDELNILAQLDAVTMN